MTKKEFTDPFMNMPAGGTSFQKHVFLKLCFLFKDFAGDLYDLMPEDDQARVDAMGKLLLAQNDAFDSVMPVTAQLAPLNQVKETQDAPKKKGRPKKSA